MYLVRNPGLTEQVVVENDWRAVAGIAVGTAFNFLPNIELCNAQQDFVPWVATHEDMEAMDWSGVGGVGEPGDNWKVIFDMEVGAFHPPDGEEYGVTGYTSIIQAPESIANVVSLHAWYLPELTPAKCQFAIFFTTNTLESDEQLVDELNVAGIQILLGDTVYDLSHDFRAYTFAATNENQVRFVFDDVNTSNDVYKMHQYLKSQVGRTIRVYITW
ncbi:hypothetical protein E0L21_09835 [Kosakonia quasisacchari]|uniref:Uncharacterized protein n=1 Tax=Kosakonia quasisacchari TaxID=2529380 RepID=A0A4R0HIQ5_9ENTR|nr:hypothetical protein E0L21_09835 [Kosakonia quasisacchari]